MKWTHRVMVCLCACALLAGTPAWSLVLNPTYTNGGGEVWDDTRRGVVNQALGEWEAVFANVNETVDVAVTFANAGTGGYLGQWSGAAGISWYGQDNPAPGPTPVRPWDVDTLNAGAGTGATITITHTIRFNADLMDTGETNYLWFDPDLSGGGEVPFVVWDALSIARHEIGHMLGITGGLYMDDYYDTGVYTWASQVTGSTFDAGGLDLPLAAADNISHFADSGVTTDDLMNPALTNGQRREISDNDIDALEVAYGYDLIPEPASLTLMATSVVLLLRRRRRAA